MSDNEEGWDLATCDPKLKEVLIKFDYDGNGFVSKDEVAMGADLYVKEQKITKKQRKQMHWLFATIIGLFLLSGGLAVGLSLKTVHKIDATKDTLVGPSGKMMVKNTSAAAALPSLSTRRLMPSWMDMLSNISPSSSRLLEDETDTSEEDLDNTIVDDIVVTIRSDGTTYSPEVIEGTNCYSQEDVSGMFMSVATGVATTLAETNQTTNDFHVHQLGISSCPDSDIVWSDVDVRLGCIVMIPSLDCTNMARRDRHLSELANEDAMQDHHRALQEYVTNNLASGGGGLTAVNHNHRNLGQAQRDRFYYVRGFQVGVLSGFQRGFNAGVQGKCGTCKKCDICQTVEFLVDKCRAQVGTGRSDESQPILENCVCRGSFYNSKTDSTLLFADENCVSVNAPSARGECKSMQLKHNVRVDVDWGTLPQAQQQRWKDLDCNRVVNSNA